MRIGQNPAKFIDHVVRPARITVAVITYIPFLGGYYSQSLEVLKACLESIWQNTDLPYDLLVFDNASCPETRQYLQHQHQQGRIQYLVLSEKNIGKGGAWNFIFGGAPGEYIAYADSDIYFFPGWLSNLVNIVEQLPNVGMVTGLPLRSPQELSTSTITWAEKHPEAHLERGQFISWEDYWHHSSSLGKDEQEAHNQYQTTHDVQLTYRGEKYLVGAGHFQFIARRNVLQQTLPIPSDRPMGQVRSLDVAINQNNYLRLSTPQWWVQHLGNTLEGLKEYKLIENQSDKQEINRSKKYNIWSWKPARKILFWIHNRSFRLLYRDKTSKYL